MGTGQNCTSPLALGTSQTLSGTTTGRTNNFRAQTSSNGCKAPSEASNDIVYQVVVPARTSVTVTTNATWDLVLNAVRAPVSNCGTFAGGFTTGMICTDSSDFTTQTETVVLVNGDNTDVTWFVIVDGYLAADVGAFTISTTPRSMPAMTTTEIEPNDTRVLADASGQQFSGSTPFSGVLGVSEADLFKIVVTTSGVLRVDADALDCRQFSSTQLAVLDSNAAVVKSDTARARVSCITMLMNVEPGTYYVSLARTATAMTAAPYWLTATVQTSRLTETEPNDTSNQANLINGSSVVVCGSLAASGDVNDSYLITVAQAEQLHAEIIEGSSTSTPTCEALSLDSRIDLMSGAGIVLQTDTSSGRGNCSRLEAALTPGTYVLRVSEVSTLRAGFPYCLAVRRY